MLHRDIALNFIKANPGCTSNDIAKGCGVLLNTITGTLTHLHEEGLVSRQKKGREFHYQIAEAKPAVEPDSPWKQRALELQDKVDALYAWKQAAIAKHPDLGEDPLLPRARKIVADMYRAKPDADEGTLGFADRIEDGQYDVLVEIQAAMAALRATTEAVPA